MSSLPPELENVVTAAKAYGDSTAAEPLAQLATAQREIVRLQTELDALKKSKQSTLYGLNFAQSGASVYESRAKAARIFLQGLGTTKWSDIARVQRATTLGITTFVVSWKDQDINHVRAFLASIPKGLTVYACFNHEPENDHGDAGSASYAQWSKDWKDQWSKQSPVIREYGFIPTQILMGWTLFPMSGRKVEDWTAPKGTVDVFAFDGYVNKFAPKEMVNAMVAATKAAGLTRTGLAETGSQLTDTGRTKKLTDLKTEIDKAEVPFEWAIYWNAADPGFDCHLNDVDADVWFGK